jgi:HlyD family secretion protein
MSAGPVLASNPPETVARAGYERLDALVRITTIQSWIYLATLFAAGVAAVVFAVFYRVPTKVMGEGILLTEQDTLSQVRAQATGRLVSLRVKLGEHVDAESVIGVISQDDLRDTIDEAASKLGDLKREDDELTQFDLREKTIHDEAMARLRRATDEDYENSKNKLKIAERLANGADKLRQKLIMSDLELLESREKKFDILGSLNKGKTRLAELELEATKAENGRLRSRLERRLKIEQHARKLAMDRAKMERTSQVKTHVSGHVAQVLSARDELVREGAPVVLLHAPKPERSTDDTDDEEKPYDAIIFVPAGEGKKIDVKDLVEVSPATVKREEHGFIVGRVVAVSELPATKLNMETSLQHPELVESFLKRYAPGVLLRIQVKLDGATEPELAYAKKVNLRPNQFHWSTSSGIVQPLKTGTMCQAAMVVEKRPLISLVLPWTKHMVGFDR